MRWHLLFLMLVTATWTIARTKLEYCRYSTDFKLAGEDFQHILRVLNTNVDGKQNMFALTSIKDIGRRANIVCKKG